MYASGNNAARKKKDASQRTNVHCSYRECENRRRGEQIDLIEVHVCECLVGGRALNGALSTIHCQ